MGGWMGMTPTLEGRPSVEIPREKTYPEGIEEDCELKHLSSRDQNQPRDRE